MKPNKMRREEFQEVLDRNWTRVEMLVRRPDWMRNIPAILCLASGSNCEPRSTEVKGKVYLDIVGGIDVVRFDPKDATLGFPFNVDHYVVLKDPDSDDMLFAEGPLKSHEHWLKQLPERFLNAEILTYEAKRGEGE